MLCFQRLTHERARSSDGNFRFVDNPGTTPASAPEAPIYSIERNINRVGIKDARGSLYNVESESVEVIGARGEHACWPLTKFTSVMPSRLRNWPAGTAFNGSAT